MEITSADTTCKSTAYLLQKYKTYLATITIVTFSQHKYPIVISIEINLYHASTFSLKLINEPTQTNTLNLYTKLGITLSYTSLHKTNPIYCYIINLSYTLYLLEQRYRCYEYYDVLTKIMFNYPFLHKQMYNISSFLLPSLPHFKELLPFVYVYYVFLFLLLIKWRTLKK